MSRGAHCSRIRWLFAIGLVIRLDDLEGEDMFIDPLCGRVAV
jgi:hypothetical protein